MEGGLVGNRTFEEYIAYYEDLYGEDMDVWMGKKHISLRTRLTQFYEKFGDSYDYSGMGVPGKSRDKIKVICRKHGEFSRTPGSLKRGLGCPKCIAEDSKRELHSRITERLLEKFKKKHDNKYDYSLFEYVDQISKVKIICPDHGIFEQTVGVHAKNGCPKCAVLVRKQSILKTQDEMIAKFREVHGDRYDYSLVNYEINNKKVKIICREHGVFEQLPRTHYTIPKTTGKPIGCPKCGAGLRSDKARKSNETWIKEFKQIHGERFDYKESFFYQRRKTSVFCRKHNNFFKVNAFAHREDKSGGCPLCLYEIQTSMHLHEQEYVIARFRDVHGKKYDYTKVEYTGLSKQITIGCPLHGDFRQKPVNHLAGKGCRKCAESKAETRVRVFLEEQGVLFEQEKIYEDCQYKAVLRFDFFLPGLNCLIECNGEQHYFPVSKFGGMKRYIAQQKRDTIKREYVRDNGITLVEIPFWMEQEEVICLLRNLIGVEQTVNLEDFQDTISATRRIFDKLYPLYSDGNLIYSWKTNQKMDEEMSVFCYKHKTFKETPNNLLKGIHCPECMKEENEDE